MGNASWSRVCVRVVGALALVGSLVGQPVAAAPADASAACAIASNFAGLVAALGSAAVGACVAAPYRDAANQATVQQTTRGLLTASDTGAWTAFTNGKSTWVDGPAGIVQQDTPNAEASSGQAHAVHLFKQKGQRTRDQSPPIPGPLMYQGGPVERTGSTNYTIYWQPSGTVMDGNYKTLINRFFSDLNDSALYGLLTQYSDTGGSIQNNSKLGGSWTDTSAYPPSISNECVNAGKSFNCLGDDDLQNEVQRAISVNNWPVGGNNNYVLFTASGEMSCDSSGNCSDTVFCAYHSDFIALGGDIKYFNMPYVLDDGYGCDTGTYPNNDVAADIEINVTSHEAFETITDEDVGIGNLAWVDASGNEIGDKCAFNFGPLNAQGGDVVLNGHSYIVQQEWSNVANDWP